MPPSSIESVTQLQPNADPSPNHLFNLNGRLGRQLPWRRLLPFGLITILATSGIWFVRSQGGLERLELWGYDAWVRSHEPQPLDPRLVIVGIEEADLQQYGWPIADQYLAQALEILEQHHPRIIGLDIFRDLPIQPGTERLQKLLQGTNRVISACKVGDTQFSAIAPPPGAQPHSTGFIDFVVDPDGVVRRNLLAMTPPDGSCNAEYSFSLLLAMRYFATEGIFPTVSLQGYPQFGTTVFEPMQSNTGGYHNIDSRGYQVLLRYRTSTLVAQHLSLKSILEQTFEPAWIKDRIILIGYVAPSVKDTFYTPFTAGQKERQPTPGVVLHAQMLSQLLSTVLESQPLWWAWPDWAEFVWMLGWTVLAGIGIYRSPRPLIWLIGVLCTLGALLGLTWLAWRAAGWLPWVPSCLAILGSSTGLIVYRAYGAQQKEQQMLFHVQEQDQAIESLRRIIQDRDVWQPLDTKSELVVQDLVCSTLGGRYYVQHLLGRGGFARTYLAEDRQRPGSPRCVVKCLQPVSSQPEVVRASRRLFQVEAEILEQLGQHDRIPQLLAYFEENRFFYLVEEFIDGHSLLAELQPYSPWSEAKVITLLIDTLDVLTFVHTHQIIHRDIKPSNLIRRRQDQKLVLIDFGAVKQLQPTTSAQQASASLKIGTPGYAAPEQLAGHPQLSSDLYSLGIMAIQALTGLPPQSIPRNLSTREFDWDVLALPCSSALTIILKRMTGSDMQMRYADARTLLQALQF